MSLSIQGKVHKIFDEQHISGSFKKREFVIETDEKYPQLVKFELVQDKTDLIDPFKVGTVVEVFFNLRGREWNDKYFTNLHAWKIEGIPTQNKDGGLLKKLANEEPVNEEVLDSNTDDLPF